MNPIIRLLNRFSNWWNMEEFTYNDDIAMIRHEAPFRGLILDADEPLCVSPDVYLFNAYELDTKRQLRFRATVLRGNVIFERVGYV